VWPSSPRRRAPRRRLGRGMLRSDVRRESGEARAPHAGDFAGVDKGLEQLFRTQHADGSWHGDYGGPMFLLPLYVATCHVTGLEPEPGVRQDMLRYLKAHQNADGGFGLHIEAKSSVFTTSLNYVGARLLGEPASAEWLARARAWLREHGGPTHSSSWGKYFLAVLGLY